MSSRDKLLHPIFLLSIILLLTNDFFLKAYFHNELTGKLSDFAGLFAFPFFWSAVFPKRINFIHLSTVIIFLFWKSGHSQPLINFINLFGFQTFRTVDYTDYIAFISVLASYITFFKPPFATSRPSIIRFIALISIFAFVATTQERQQPTYEEDFKTIDLYNQSVHQLTVVVNFKYSDVELAGDTSLDNEFNRIDTLKLASGSYNTVRTPIPSWNNSKFPSGFKIIIIDSLGKLQKIYNKTAFLMAVDTSYNRQAQHESGSSWSLKIGKKIPEKIAPYTIYGRWQTTSSSQRQHTFEIRERYCYDVDPDSDLARYELKDSLITVMYPKKRVSGRITYLSENELYITWDDRKKLKYKKLYH
ncbi:hypothetical protein GJU39_12400 [Pedobacter petrophilus]|uniref:Uncharacterized protein n=1 Tax=Pedobacter petrophilus TaxID=1908241 RepID=A0A7K0FZA0_9SPHI|nr:hypothetical protein [Pedobacter petrophilus]MRX76888.1 hypothetical protein [Pedobacter petrophilus]